MLLKIRQANLLFMLTFLLALFVPAGWVAALPSESSSTQPVVNHSPDGFDCKFDRQPHITVSSQPHLTTTTATIGDYMWFDANGNGIQDAFPNRSGALSLSKGSPAENPSVPQTGVSGVLCVLCELGKVQPVGQALTNAQGYYSFTVEISQTTEYYLVVQAPEGLTFTTKDVGDNDQIDSDVNPETGRTDNFMIAPGEQNNTIDVGFVNKPTAVMTLSPPTMTIGAGEAFEAEIQVQSDFSYESIQELSAYLNFDPALLQVKGITPTHHVPDVQASSFDNSSGQIDFITGELASPVSSDTLTLATITFTPIGATAGTSVEFNTLAPRQSDIIFQSRSVLSSTIGNSVHIVVPTAIDSITMQSGPAPPTGHDHRFGWLALLGLGFTLLLTLRKRRR
ncbi:MAG: SdrD B-like domain-containing protein [Ardenticatenaceae bacterium]